MTAFVLGNGRSRLAFDPREFKPHGELIGCNAAYRDIDLDRLVAVDLPMIHEIMEVKAHHMCEFYIDARHQHIRNPKVNPIHTEMDTRMDSGTLALMVAAMHGHNTVYAIGFDYISNNQYHNNVFADTMNYKRTTEQHVLPETKQSWFDRQNILCNRFPLVQFIRVNANDFIPPINCPNFTNISVEQFVTDYGFTTHTIPEQFPRHMVQKKPSKQPRYTKPTEPNLPRPMWYK
jgi:hypothetical protein